MKVQCSLPFLKTKSLFILVVMTSAQYKKLSRYINFQVLGIKAKQRKCEKACWTRRGYKGVQIKLKCCTFVIYIKSCRTLVSS